MVFKSKNMLRNLFSLYSYFLNITILINDLLPPLFRNFILRLLFKKMGKNVYIDYGVYFRFPKKIEIGNEVTIGKGSKLFPSFHNSEAYIRIGNNIRIGPDVLFLSAGHDYKHLSLPDTGGTIIINDNVWIGARSIILQGVTIGEGAVVAAGSIVTKNVDNYMIIAGNPAKIIKERKIDATNKI